MNNTEKCIEELLTSTKLSAPDVTCPLKKIGRGNMLDGIRRIHNHGFTTGFIVGGILGITAYAGYNAHKYIKPHLTKKQPHKKTEKELQAITNKGNVEIIKKEVA